MAVLNLQATPNRRDVSCYRPALEAGVLLEVQGRLWRAFPWQADAPIQPEAEGFRPTNLSKSIIMGSLPPTGYGVAIFTLDLSECDLLLPACFLEFAS